MSLLTLRLFGPGVLSADGAPVRAHSARTLALLTYLALEADRPHARSGLAALLWEGEPEASSRQGLRQALYSLRNLAQGRLRPCLIAEPAWVQFVTDVPNDAVFVDVHRFLAAVRGTDEGQWGEAATLYRAPLLEGSRLVGAGAFDDWLSTTRERLHALAMHNLSRLVASHMARAELEVAQGYAEAMRELDPTSEAASQFLMRILAERGMRAMADAEWARLRTLLRHQFDVEPSTETAQLRQSLRLSGAGGAGTGSTPAGATEAMTGGLPSAASPGLTCDAESMVRAGQAAERVGAYNQAGDLYDRALQVMQRDRPESPRRRVDVLLLREAVLDRLGRRADQKAVLDEALALAEHLDDAARIAVILLRRAGANAYLKRHPEARAAAERALKIFRHLGDQPGEAEALRELCFVHWHAEDYTEALHLAREVLALHRRIGDNAGEATALHNLAEIHRGLGSPRQGIPWFEQSLQLHWATGNHGGAILSLFGWAQALQQSGELPASRQKYEAALALSEQHGERIMRSRALHALAMQAAGQGHLDPALALIRQAIDIDRAIGYAHALGHDLVDLSHIHHGRGELAQARVALQEALVWFGFTEDTDALDAARSRLVGLEAPGGGPMPPSPLRGGVKSHLPLSEGKVYCAFESPLGRQLLR